MNGGTTKDQLARLLALAPYLQSRGDVPLKEVAEDFGVTTEQVLRDLRVLYLCGLPGFGPGELIDINVEALMDDPEGMVRIDNADYLARPLRLGSNEASALIVALRALLDSSTIATREVVERTLSKLELAAEAGSLPLVDVRIPEQRTALAGPRNALEQALRSDRQARIEYLVPARDEVTERIVDPIALLLQDGNTYLDAWCHLVDARRLFRVDRVASVEVLDSARQRPDLEPRDLAAGLFEAGPADALARLRLEPGMSWFAGYYPVLEVVDLPDGAQEVTLAVSDEQWLLRLAMRFGHGLTVIDPPALGAAVRSVAADALRLQQATAYDGKVSDNRTE